ncbi:MAG: helix-turn-helix domain-containing protein [Planctomycetota bacterium]
MNFQDISERLDRIESLILLSNQNQNTREYYNTAEVAAILNKAEFTVREWCRLGRINAEKRKAGRGTAKEWMISRQEVNRIKNEGLLATCRKFN